MRRTGSLFSLLFLGFLALSASAHELPSGNLAALGRVWGIVQHAHPWPGYRDVDLDAAALRAIARVRGSSTPEALSAAIDEMLATLRDDASFVSRPCYEDPTATINRSARVLGDGIAYISATSQSATVLRNARAAIVDLRVQPGRCSAPTISYDLVPLLVRGTVPYPDHRKVRHHGYRSETTTAFDSTFSTVDLGRETGTAETMTRVVFIVDERSHIPPFAAALAASEMATFVSVGRFPLHTAVDHCQMVLPDNSIVTLRTSELVDDDGYSAEPAAMITLAANAAESDVLAAAEKLARPRVSGRRRSVGLKPVRLPDYRWRAEKSYAELVAPTPEHRILAAYRIWNNIHFFHGSRESLGMQWDMHFEHIVSMLEHASTRRDYEVALTEIMALVPDGQASVALPRDTATPPFRLLAIEGKPIVVHGTDTIKPGDELLRIDGRNVDARMTELARITSAANVVAKQHAIISALTTGANGSSSAFTFRRADGTTYDVTLPRTEATAPAPVKAWRILEGNIAYADMQALSEADVATMFAEIANTRALILDLRGEPRADHEELIARIRTNGSSVASLTRVPQLVGGASQYADVPQLLDEVTAPRYLGRTIALIDARTQGRGEAIALAVDALASAQFVGGVSAGTSGAVTSFAVPGNVVVRFTGSAVRHAEGWELVPDVAAAPTIAGVAAARDEVLERAIRLVDEM